MKQITKLGHRVFRNNVGQFKTLDGRTIRTGLCVGSSDLIGFTSCGRFLAIECKAPNKKLTAQQENFINVVNSFGGVGFVCDDEKKLKKILDEKLK